MDIVITVVNNFKGHLFYTFDVKDKKGRRKFQEDVPSLLHGEASLPKFGQESSLKHSLVKH